MPIFRYETDKGTFEIESNRELNPRELEHTISVEQPQKDVGAITEPKDTLQTKFRGFLLGSELAQPLRSLFFEQEKEVGTERARATVLGASKIFGVPQLLTKAAGLKPETIAQTEEKGFEVLGKVGGILAPGAVGQALASKLVPALGKTAPLLAKLSNTGLRGLIRGGTTGALISPEKDFTNVKARGQQAVTFGILDALLSGGFEAARSGVGSVVRGIRRLKQPAKLPLGARIAEKGAKLSKLKTEQLFKADQAKAVKLRNVTNQLDDNVAQFSDDLQRSAESGSLEAQKRLPKFSRAASKNYGDIVDDISESLAQKKVELTKGNMNEVLTKTLAEARELELPIGRTEKVIERLIEKKYGTTQFSKRFQLREVLNDSRLIKGQLKSGVQAGTKPFSDDEVVNAIFNKNFGELIAEKAPALKDLNRSYTPVIRVIKQGTKIFKPRAGEFQTKGATQFIKRAATGKLERGEAAVLDILEKGTELEGRAIAGIGPVSQPARKAAGRLAGAKRAGVKAKEAITKISAVKRQRISNKFDKEIAKVGARNKKVQLLLANKAKADQIKRLIFGGTVGLSVAIGAIKKLGGVLKGRK